MNNRALITALVRGLAFALITLIYSIVPVFHGLLWCVYIGFFLTMAFGVRKEETPNYICSLLSGYVWALGYLYGPVVLAQVLPPLAALTISELMLTFLLIFTHVKYLHATWYGRAFIRTYYTVSPTIVKLVGDTDWFQSFWRVRLDKMVSALQADGFASTPYQDRDW